MIRKSDIVNAWRLERQGKWVGYAGVKVMWTIYGFTTMDATGATLIRSRGKEKFFKTAEKAFEAVEKHLLQQGAVA